MKFLFLLSLLCFGGSRPPKFIMCIIIWEQFSRTGMGICLFGCINKDIWCPFFLIKCFHSSLRPSVTNSVGISFLEQKAHLCEESTGWVTCWLALSKRKCIHTSAFLCTIHLCLFWWPFALETLEKIYLGVKEILYNDLLQSLVDWLLDLGAVVLISFFRLKAE